RSGRASTGTRSRSSASSRSSAPRPARAARSARAAAGAGNHARPHGRPAPTRAPAAGPAPALRAARRAGGRSSPRIGYQNAAVNLSVVTDAYARHVGRYGAALSAAHADAAGVAPGDDALDVGCGPRVLLLELARRLGGDQVAGVDPSEPF